MRIVSPQRLCNLKDVRGSLGKSQSELASLLGISVRAVQSYEQGWRSCPPYVQKLAGLLMYLDWRKTHARVQPCWKVRNCPQDKRRTCAAAQFKNGEFCWIITGNCCDGKKQKSWAAKLANCIQCPVMGSWLGEAKAKSK